MEIHELFQFSTEREEGGFCWAEVIDDHLNTGQPPSSVLIPIPTGTEPSRKSLQLSLTNGTEFRELANIDSLDGHFMGRVQTFANKYGQPWPWEKQCAVRPEGCAPTKGVPLIDWIEIVGELGAAVELWDAVLAAESKNESNMKPLHFLFPSVTSETIQMSADKLAVLRRLGVDARAVAPVKPKGISDDDARIRVARELVSRIVNHCIIKHEILLTVNPGGALDSLPMTFTAESLIGGIWIQFVDWVQTGRVVKRCQWCECWISSPNKISGPRRLFCKTECRKASDQQKRLEVKSLARETTDSVQSIARAVGLGREVTRRLVQAERAKNSRPTKTSIRNRQAKSVRRTEESRLNIQAR